MATMYPELHRRIFSHSTSGSAYYAYHIMYDDLTGKDFVVRPGVPGGGGNIQGLVLPHNSQIPLGSFDYTIGSGHSALTAAKGFIWYFLIKTADLKIYVSKMDCITGARTDHFNSVAILHTSTHLGGGENTCVYDGADYIYFTEGPCTTVDGTVVIWSYRISTNTFAVVKDDVITASKSIYVTGLGLRDGILYYSCYNSTDLVSYFRSVAVGGGTVTAIESNVGSTIMCRTGYRGYHIRGRVLYNYNRSSNWTLTGGSDTSLYCMYVFDATVPKIFYLDTVPSTVWRSHLGGTQIESFVITTASPIRAIYGMAGGDGQPNSTSSWLLGFANVRLYFETLGRSLD